jgi:hypothetical protein
MPRTRKRLRKNRGMPAPATFDIDTLPGSSNLIALEASAVICRTPGVLEQWRPDQNHPLKWSYVDGRPLYRVDAVLMHSREAINAIAQALSPGVATTRRETQQRLSVDYRRDTIPSLLALLARDGHVLAKGDVLQPCYRLAENT